LKTADLHDVAGNVVSPHLRNVGSFIPHYNSSQSVGQEYSLLTCSVRSRNNM
jgi:hypothetical protein